MGLFVTLEGPEGSGKTTQINLLEEALTALGYHVVCTREPGGTEVGKQIRALLLDARNAALVPEAEILLYSADRAQHVAEKVRPALDKGAIVISDRYAESTFAYQGYGRGLDMEMLSDITRLATGGLQPDLVIYLDLPVEDGLARKHKEHIKGTGEWNRMDDQSLVFYNKVRDGYLAMAERAPERWLRLDASEPIEVLHREIVARITALAAVKADVAQARKE